MGRDQHAKRDELYKVATRDFGPALDRVAAGYEADPERRRDLRQEIHLQLWRSFELFDERCSLKTWTFRVAHNTGVSWVGRERRTSARLLSLEEIETTLVSNPVAPDIDHQRALERLLALILKLKPLDRQIMLSYLEEMDATAIAAITGLSPANVSMKVHRIKNILIRQFRQERDHV